MAAKITILCDFDATKRPRPARLIAMLKHKYEISVIAKECSQIEGVATFSFPPLLTAKERSVKQTQELITHCHNGYFEKLIFTQNRLCIRDFLHQLTPQDLLIIEDITLLPFGLEYKSLYPHTKILIDLREYYPLEYENDKIWRESFGLFFTHLCQVYLPQVDYALCVSEGIARKYYEDFGVLSDVFFSLPPYYELTPTKPHTPLKILYHGFVSPDRSSTNLITIANKLPCTHTLYAMVLSNQPNFLESLRTKAPKNLIFLPPVMLEEIVPLSNSFDIGLIPFFPTTFNLAHCLPNKFFEYLQARLCIVSTPLSEIKNFLDSYQCGVYASDFSVDSVVQTLSHLHSDEVFRYKQQAHTLAYEFSTQHNIHKIYQILTKLLD